MYTIVVPVERQQLKQFLSLSKTFRFMESIVMKGKSEGEVERERETISHSN